VVSKERKIPKFQKIKVIQDMSWLKRLVDVQIFNGFAQFHYIYIKFYTYVMDPIMRLMRKT
jgi:hypothetical protein